MISELLYNHIDLCRLIYKGKNVEISAYIENINKELEELNLYEKKIYLNNLNIAIYNYILYKENLSLHNVCNSNDTKISQLDSSNYNFIMLSIIESYLTSSEYNKKRVKNPNILKAIDYIESNIENVITLDIVADKLQINKCYLCDIFKKEMDTSFNDYVGEKRIDLAKDLLKNTDFPITKIAEMSGFNNYSYFSTYFKKITGITPNSYKKQKASIAREN